MCSTPVIGVNATAVAEVDWTYWYVDVLEPGEYGLLIRRGPSWDWSGMGDDQDGGGGIGTSQWPNYAIQRDWLSLMRNGDCGGEQDADGFYNGGWWLDRSSVGRFPKIGDNTGGTFYYKSGDEGRYDLYKIIPRDKFQRIDCAKKMFGLLQKTKKAFTQIMQEFGFDAHGAAVADHTDSDATMRPNLQNLFNLCGPIRLKMLHQDADGKCLDLFVVPFDMPQADPTFMPKKEKFQDKSTRCRSRGAKDMKTMPKKDMKTMPKKEKDMKTMPKKGKFQEKSTRCRSRGAKHYKKVIHPRQRVTYKKPSALEKATEVSAWSLDAID